jgi:hypothetical protein
MVSRITDPAEYAHALARRELVAAPLRDADSLPPGALPVSVREGLRTLLLRLDEQITQYERDLDQALARRSGLRR